MEAGGGSRGAGVAWAIRQPAPDRRPHAARARRYARLTISKQHNRALGCVYKKLMNGEVAVDFLDFSRSTPATEIPIVKPFVQQEHFCGAFLYVNRNSKKYHHF